MNTSPDIRLFKRLTLENWLHRDTTVDPFVQIKNGIATKLSGDDWAASILESNLSATVPDDIRNLFEVAQGVLCYGCFFYPLYTLGSEQVYRVLEAAIHYKCAALGAPQSANTFANGLKWLGTRDILSEVQLEQWHAARKLRNITSHAVRQGLYDPTMAVGGVRLAAELINELFDETDSEQ